jgi:hypothetical protein
MKDVYQSFQQHTFEWADQNGIAAEMGLETELVLLKLNKTQHLLFCRSDDDKENERVEVRLGHENSGFRHIGNIEPQLQNVIRFLNGMKR